MENRMRCLDWRRLCSVSTAVVSSSTRRETHRPLTSPSAETRLPRSGFRYTHVHWSFHGQDLDLLKVSSYYLLSIDMRVDRCCVILYLFQVIGSLAMVEPNPGTQLQGVLVKRNFNYHILAPSDLNRKYLIIGIYELWFLSFCVYERNIIDFLWNHIN